MIHSQTPKKFQFHHILAPIQKKRSRSHLFEQKILVIHDTLVPERWRLRLRAEVSDGRSSKRRREDMGVPVKRGQVGDSDGGDNAPARSAEIHFSSWTSATDFWIFFGGIRVFVSGFRMDLEFEKKIDGAFCRRGEERFWKLRKTLPQETCPLHQETLVPRSGSIRSGRAQLRRFLLMF